MAYIDKLIAASDQWHIRQANPTTMFPNEMYIGASIGSNMTGYFDPNIPELAGTQIISAMLTYDLSGIGTKASYVEISYRADPERRTYNQSSGAIGSTVYANPIGVTEHEANILTVMQNYADAGANGYISMFTDDDTVTSNKLINAYIMITYNDRLTRLKVRTGSATWVEAKEVKRWNGTTWEKKPVKLSKGGVWIDA
jgi:hypothetical protein